MGRSQREKNEKRKHEETTSFEESFCSCVDVPGKVRMILDSYPGVCSVCRKVVYTPAIHDKQRPQ